jgi:hypothetical protein
MKRGYSTEHPVDWTRPKRYLLDGIPAPLWARVRAKAKRERTSVRALILTLLTAWVEEK